MDCGWYGPELAGVINIHGVIIVIGWKFVIGDIVGILVVYYESLGSTLE